MMDFSATFVITLVNITILFFILKAILFKPVTKFMAARARRFQEELDKIESEKAKAKQTLDEYEAKLAAANAEAEAILAAARENAGKEAARIVSGGKAEAEQQIAAARNLIETEKQAAYEKFKLEAAALVVAASARLVRRELSGADNKRYAAMLLDELAARKGNN